RHTRWPRDWSSDVCSSDLGPADDLPIDLRNDGGITTSDGSKPAQLIFRRPELRFEGGDAVFNALIVNFSNRCGIVYAGGPNLHAVHVWTLERAITPVPLTPLFHLSLARRPAAPRATPAWRTSLAEGIFERLASPADRRGFSVTRLSPLSQDREMREAFPSLPRGFCLSISSSSMTPMPG